MPTVEVGLPQKRCIYINFEKYRTSERPKAEASEVYNVAPIQHHIDWMMALTRFHIPLWAMPMQEAIPNPMYLAKAGHANIVFLVLERTFSIAQLLRYLNDWCRRTVSLHARTAPVGGITEPLSLKFVLTESGAIMIKSKWDYNPAVDRWEIWRDGWTLILEEQMAYLFGFEHFPFYTIADNAGGPITLVDRWDSIKGVKISAIGLPAQSEYLGGNTRGVILTDFLIGSAFNVTATETSTDATCKYIEYATSFTEAPKQAVNYQPQEYIYLNLVGASRIDDITLIAEARKCVYDDTTQLFKSEIVPIFLPKGDPFTCKLGFFTKNMPERKIYEHKNALNLH